MLRAFGRLVPSISTVSSTNTVKCLLNPLASICNLQTPASINQSQQQRSVIMYGKIYREPRFTKIKYSRETGKGESFQPVLDRYFRLNNAMWIRTIPGRNKKKYMMSQKQKIKMMRHVFCTEEECKMLDQFVEFEYKCPQFVPDDPYRPYHRKDNIKGYKYVPQRFYP